jgi:hypothetical protein
MGKIEPTAGLEYGPGVVGKYRFRVREQHVADHYCELIRTASPGAIKLDLVLRGLALLPQHAGRRRTGLVLPRITYEQLHDLCRVPSRFLTVVPEDEFADPIVLAKKRKWVGEQLRRLEDLKLVHRIERPGKRPAIVVLRDDGSGAEFDDPDGGRGNSYVTVFGALIASGWLRLWKTPEIAAYFAAMIADRYARNRQPRAGAPIGGATWYQPLAWFEDSGGQRPAGHVRTPFSTRTLERGFASLAESELVRITRTTRHPYGGRRFAHPRSVYENRFHTIEETVAKLPEKELGRVVSSTETD